MKSNTYNQTSNKWSTYVNWLVKACLIGFFVLLIYNEVIAKESIQVIWESFLVKLHSGNLLWVLIAALLVPCNWALESLKWKALTSKFEIIPFRKAFLSILCGLSIGIFTPQRIGEYGGRILLLKKRNNWRGILATFIASISQNLFNICIGLVGGGMYMISYVDTPHYVLISFLTFAVLIISMSFFFYYNLDVLIKWVKKLPYVNRNEKIQKLASKRNIYSSTDLTKINVYSLLRYAVYTSQYMLLLYFFGVSSSVVLLLIAVSTIYLVQSSIPIPPMFGILARAEIALVILGVSSANELSILSATFTLWIINLLIPSFLGLLVILKINVLQPFTSDTDRAEA